MPRKPKFKPVITRVKLNPEQAVLSCDCYNHSYRYLGGTGLWGTQVDRLISMCNLSGRGKMDYNHRVDCWYRNAPPAWPPTTEQNAGEFWTASS